MASRPGWGQQVSRWTIDVATSFEVATWVAAREVVTWRRNVTEMGLSRIDVATSLRGRDMDGSG